MNENASEESPLDKVEKLADLYDRDAITKEEFDTKKQKLMEEM